MWSVVLRPWGNLHWVSFSFGLNILRHLFSWRLATQMLVIWRSPQSTAGRTKGRRGPHAARVPRVWDPWCKAYRSMHSADCGTDHALVHSKLLIVPRKCFRRSTKCSPSINSAAMKNDSSTSLFKSLLSVKAMPDYPGTTVEDAWSKFRSLVMGCAKSAFGLRQKKQPDWFRESANVLIPAVEARREARLQLKTGNTKVAKARLLTTKANVQRRVRAALCDFWTKISTEV